MHIPNELTLLEARRRRLQDRIADQITRFSGSMLFVYLHIVWFVLWVAYNVVTPGGFDRFPFGLLTLIVSLEAIFLSTFVMISQNREAQRADIRAQLDFETNVLSEVWVEMIAAVHHIDLDQVRAKVAERMAEARAREKASAEHGSGRGSKTVDVEVMFGMGTQLVVPPASPSQPAN